MKARRLNRKARRIRSKANKTYGYLLRIEEKVDDLYRCLCDAKDKNEEIGSDDRMRIWDEMQTASLELVDVKLVADRTCRRIHKIQKHLIGY